MLVVRWMFAQRRAGHSVARITRALNDAGIPCSSASDPTRNPHRSGQGWTLTTVAAILANPRYTGPQVWNRQPSDFDLIDPANTSLGHCSTAANTRQAIQIRPARSLGPPGPRS